MRRFLRSVLFGIVALALLGVAPTDVSAAVAPRPVVTAPGTPAWDAAGPDPALVKVGNGVWYAYTTGTAWGNHIGVLTSTQPNGGWHTITGKPYGSTALGPLPAWQQPDTQWAPGVYAFAGRWVMFYAARVQSNGKWCISVATSSSPRGPFLDRTTAPIICQPNLGGSIDPQPFVDADGQPWLHWKNNDGSSPAVSQVWAVRLKADGVTLGGPIRSVLAKDTQHHPWMTTVDNPQMVIVSGIRYLFFTGGNWESSGYTTGYAVCSSAIGPCTVANEPLLRSYGIVAGPGGGTMARDEAGRWWMSFHAWTKGCTSDRCGGTRRLYVASLAFR